MLNDRSTGPSKDTDKYGHLLSAVSIIWPAQRPSQNFSFSLTFILPSREFRVFVGMLSNAGVVHMCLSTEVILLLKISILLAWNAQCPWETFENFSRMKRWSSLAPAAGLCRVLSPPTINHRAFHSFLPWCWPSNGTHPFSLTTTQTKPYTRTCFVEDFIEGFRRWKEFVMQQCKLLVFSVLRRRFLVFSILKNF